MPLDAQQETRRREIVGILMKVQLRKTQLPAEEQRALRGELAGLTAAEQSAPQASLDPATKSRVDEINAQLREGAGGKYMPAWDRKQLVDELCDLINPQPADDGGGADRGVP